MSKAKFVVLLFLFIFMAAGCIAPLPPAQPASDLSAIAGKWEGSMTSMSGTVYFSTKTIGTDGRYELDVPGLGVFTGSIAVVDGKYRSKSDSNGRMFTETLHEGDGKRVLVSRSDDGLNSSQYTQRK
jgi:hypothetical protein